MLQIKIQFVITITTANSNLISALFILGYSNAHYGHPRNIIKPNNGETMADGWETARRLDRPEVLEAKDDGTLKVLGKYL